MTEVIYDKRITGLLVIDPYNDIIPEGGKVWRSTCKQLSPSTCRITPVPL